MKYKVEGCTLSEFECSNGNCIPTNERCDDAFDCVLPDTSDEENCNVTVTCPEGQHKCNNGQCVSHVSACPSDNSTSSTNISSSSSSSGSNLWIIGAVLGPFLIVFVVLFLIYWFKIRKRTNDQTGGIFDNRVNPVPDNQPPLSTDRV